MAYDVNRVADYLCWFSERHGDWLTNLKLQKLLYYAQAWYLVNYNDVLFENPIEAWIHGPVVYDVWKRHEKVGRAFLPTIESEPELPEDVKEFLRQVLEVYGSDSAYTLEERTHREKPWLEARGELAPDVPSNAVINTQTMHDYFQSILDDNGEKQD